MIITAETYKEFIKNHLGRGVDVDGTAGVQCVDLIKAYLSEVFGIKAGSWGDARYYYERFKDKSWGGYNKMNKAFVRIENTPDFVPQKGDICVWGPDVSSSHNSGHISIANGTGNTSYFYSHDQNWNGKPMKAVKHSYKAFYGVLRPRNQSLITGEGSGRYVVTASALNVRNGPGTTYARGSLLQNGTEVEVIAQKGNWSQLAPDRWVYSAYIKKL